MPRTAVALQAALLQLIQRRAQPNTVSVNKIMAKNGPNIWLPCIFYVPSVLASMALRHLASFCGYAIAA